MHSTGAAVPHWACLAQPGHQADGISVDGVAQPICALEPSPAPSLPAVKSLFLFSLAKALDSLISDLAEN